MKTSLKSVEVAKVLATFKQNIDQINKVKKILFPKGRKGVPGGNLQGRIAQLVKYVDALLRDDNLFTAIDTLFHLSGNKNGLSTEDITFRHDLREAFFLGKKKLVSDYGFNFEAGNLVIEDPARFMKDFRKFFSQKGPCFQTYRFLNRYYQKSSGEKIKIDTTTTKTLPKKKKTGTRRRFCGGQAKPHQITVTSPPPWHVVQPEPKRVSR